MPGIGGRFGWNEPPPAAITTTLHSKILPASVVTRNSGSPIFSIVSTISLRWKVGLNGLICSISASVRPWPVTIGNAGNVVDRLFRIKLGALPAELVEDVDEMRLDVEQAQFENGEQAARARADDQHIGFDRFAHLNASFRLHPARRPRAFGLRLSSQRRGARKAINGRLGCPATPCRS